MQINRVKAWFEKLYYLFVYEYIWRHFHNWSDIGSDNICFAL